MRRREALKSAFYALKVLTIYDVLANLEPIVLTR